MDYELEAGRPGAERIAWSRTRRFCARQPRPGDTLDVVAGFDPQLRGYTGQRRLAVAGAGRFFYTAADQPVAAMPLATLQAMGGPERADRVSLFLVKVRVGQADSGRLLGRARSASRLHDLDGVGLRQVDDRMGYFRQLALILGTISLVVGFLLVTTLVTVSVKSEWVKSPSCAPSA